MATPTARLVLALRDTAARLRSPAVVYQWSHFGHCNCGHLAQTLTGKSAQEIYRAAMRREGDWGQQAAELPDLGDRPALDEGAFEPPALDLCTATRSPLAAVLAEMAAAGLDRDDIDHLEDLSDGAVLRAMGASTTGLARNDRGHVVRYLDAWADLLERQLDPAERARLLTDDEPAAIAAEE